VSTDPQPASGQRSGEQWALAVFGVISFVLGVSVHRDRQNLAVVLVGVGVLLLVIATLLPRIATLSGKVGGVEFAVGLVPSPTVTTDQSLANAKPPSGPVDLRSAGAPPSGSAGFADAIKGGNAEVLVINLEMGEAWLTSRLFIFVVALRSLRGLEAVVFTHRPRDSDVVVGIAPAATVVDRLGWAYPSLPQALGAAWEMVRRNKTVGLEVLSLADADFLYQMYVSKLNAVPQPTDPGGPTVRLTDGRSERAAWIDSSLIRQILGSDLSVVRVRERASDNSPLLQPERAALAFTGVRYVPVVSDRDEFRSVVDRFAVLDAVRTAHSP
jgi:hypothetical protein